MLRKYTKYYMPPVFALSSFLLYMIIYHPSLGSEDFITAVLVFCAALGSSSLILLAKERKRKILSLYQVCSIIIPLLLAIFSKNFNPLWHGIIIGLIFMGIIALKLFETDYFKYRKEM